MDMTKYIIVIIFNGIFYENTYRKTALRMKKPFKDTLLFALSTLAHLNSIIIHATRDEELPLDVTHILLPSRCTRATFMHLWHVLRAFLSDVSVSTGNFTYKFLRI